jgi:hypothetical protein
MEKDQIRKEIWQLIEERGIARFPRPVYGRIPNFEAPAQEIPGTKIDVSHAILKD